MNYFEPYTWENILTLYPEQSYSASEYHKILCAPEDFPEFVNKYLELPLLKRLKGIGLLCGTDWTKLYRNRFYYSRFDHSLGVALIIWHFTHDKAQTIAGLLHDVSTPVFSHVSDFRKGDALTQTATEEDNTSLIRCDSKLLELLKMDGLTVEQVENYHNYPIADNEIPQLSADRLEYMFPSGMALEGSWSMDDVKRAYNDITILTNENGQQELGFKTLEIAEDYCRRFCMTGHVLQLNENKLTLHMLGQIMNISVELGILDEWDFMNLTEAQLIEKLGGALNCGEKMGTDPSLHNLSRLYKTFRNMTLIEHTQEARDPDNYFCVSLNVKQRFINPLVLLSENGEAKNGDRPLGTQQKNGDRPLCTRLSKASPFANGLIQDFLTYQDTAFGCVKLI